MLLLWFHNSNALLPLSESLPIALLFAFWTIVAPSLVRRYGIRFLSFDSLETADSQLFFSRGNTLRYLNSLRVPNLQQLVTVPLYQLGLNFVFGVSYFLLSRSDVSLFITLPVATLGGYLAVRSLCYSVGLIYSFIFGDIFPKLNS